MLVFKQKAKPWTSAFSVTVLYSIYSTKLAQTEYLEFKRTVPEKLTILLSKAMYLLGTSGPTTNKLFSSICGAWFCDPIWGTTGKFLGVEGPAGTASARRGQGCPLPDTAGSSQVQLMHHRARLSLPARQGCIRVNICQKWQEIPQKADKASVVGGAPWQSR